MTHKIDWLNMPGYTGATWNPITGCTPVSPGCAHCYAERMAKRLRGRYGYPEDEPFRVTVHRERFDEPLHWRRPRMIFVCSMGDWLHESLDVSVPLELLNVMGLCPQHQFVTLTKRAQALWLFEDAYDSYVDEPAWMSNVWHGVTAEDQPRADERIPDLLATPAAVRWVSFEPLLGEVHARPAWIRSQRGCDCTHRHPRPLDWVVIGCESGPKRRPCKIEWVRSLVQQCRAAGVPVFVKQIQDEQGNVLRPMILDNPPAYDAIYPDAWPEDLRLREWPEVKG